MRTNDWPLMRLLMHDDVSWTLPGESLLSGPANGVDAVVRRAQSLQAFGVMFDLLHVLYGLHNVAISLHNTAKRGELILDEYVVIVFEPNDDGKIIKMTTHLSDVNGINRFFVPGII
ncbi:MAG: nuclear transport factor 2 family protein [Bacteroidetes bacterium]|nr:nuclear transport factor 2 family protein [Bacteroidota bacterium]